MKYVMFRVNRPAMLNKLPVVDTAYFYIQFPDLIVHKQVAIAIERMNLTDGIGGWVHPKAVSAGFLTRDDLGRYVCMGESESMRVKAHKDDTEIINTFNIVYGRGFDPRSEIA